MYSLGSGRRTIRRGLGEFVPARAYDLPAERVNIQEVKFPQVTDPARFGVVFMNVGEAYLFRLLVKAGLIPNTAEGYETMLAYVGQGAERNNPAEPYAGFWRIVSDYYGRAQAIQDSFNAKYAGIPGVATRFLVAQNYFPLDEFANVSSFTPSSGPVDIAAPVPVTVIATIPQWLEMPGSSEGTLQEAPVGLFRLVGRRAFSILSNGQGQVGPWEKLPREFIVRSDGLDQSFRSPQNPSVPVLYPVIGATDLPAAFDYLQGGRAEWPVNSGTAPAIMDAERAFVAFMQGTGWTPPASWGHVLETAVATPAPPIPPLPGGSTVFVPAPGSGKEPTVKLPGTTDFIPISSVPPEVIRQAAAEPSSPPTIVSGGGGGGGGLVPRITRDPATGEVVAEEGPGMQLAGFGGLAGLLLLGLVVAGGSGKRSRVRR